MAEWPRYSGREILLIIMLIVSNEKRGMMISRFSSLSRRYIQYHGRSKPPAIMCFVRLRLHLHHHHDAAQNTQRTIHFHKLHYIVWFSVASINIIDCSNKRERNAVRCRYHALILQLTFVQVDLGIDVG